MTFIRSTIFTLFFFLWTGIITIIFLPILLLQPKYVMWSAKAWAWGVVFAARWIVGIKWEVRGLENLPKGGYIIASKHQSAFETIALYLVCNQAAFILKKELQNIPIYGWYVRRIGAIAVDRNAGVSALKDMIAQAKDRLSKGREVIIFPEGTRVEYGTKGDYHAGIAALYSKCDVPIIPLSLNTGKFWGRNSWKKSSGTIIFEFQKPIQQGLKKAEFMETLENSIEDGCKAIS